MTVHQHHVCSEGHARETIPKSQPSLTLMRAFSRPFEGSAVAKGDCASSRSRTQTCKTSSRELHGTTTYVVLRYDVTDVG